MSTEATLSGGVQQQHLAALDAGRFLIQRCDGCHRHVYFPRPVCPHCGSDQLQLVPPAGTGTVYAHSTMGSGDAAYTIAYVTLSEGPTLMTNLVGAPPADWRIGQPVRVVFVPAEGGQAVPMFRPA